MKYLTEFLKNIMYLFKNQHFTDMSRKSTAAWISFLKSRKTAPQEREMSIKILKIQLLAYLGVVHKLSLHV